MATYRTVLLGVLALTGCAEVRPTPKAAESTSEATAATVAAFQGRLAANGSITFCSHKGVMVGGDGDLTLTYFADGSVHELVWGIGLMHSSGTFGVGADGRVAHRITGRTGNLAWRLEQGPTTLLLKPENETGRGSDSDDWVFAEVTGDVEKRVLNTVAQEPRRPTK